jgi:hypothetical protein
MGEQTQHFSVFPLWDLASPFYTGAVPLFIAMLIYLLGLMTGDTASFALFGLVVLCLVSYLLS